MHILYTKYRLHDLIAEFLLAIIRNIVTRNASDLYHFLYFPFIWMFLFVFGQIELAPDLIKKYITIFNE